MKSGGRLVEHVDDPEQVRADLRGEPQALQLAGRQRRRRSIERQVAESEVGERRDALDDVVRDALRGDPLLLGEVRRAAHIGCALVRGAAGRDAGRRVDACGCAAQRLSRHCFIEASVHRRFEDLRESIERHRGEFSDVAARERHGQRGGLQPLAMTRRTRATRQVTRHALLHQRALRRRERLQHIAPRAGERAHVAWLELLPSRDAGLRGREAGIDRRGRRLVGEENPVAILLRQVAPRRVDVVAEADQDVAQVLPVPRGRPGGDRALADRQRVVGDHRCLRRVDDAAEPVAGRACAFGRVRREVLGVQHRLMRRVRAGARVQHPQQARDRRQAADRRPRARRAALLLQRDRRRQAVDAVEVRHADLIDQPSRVRGDRLEIAPLRLRVQRAERERRLSRPGDAGEHDQRVARDVDVDVLEVVFARAADADEGVGRGIGRVGGFVHRLKTDSGCGASFQRAHRASKSRGAGEGNRTLVCSLGSCRSAIELHPRGRHSTYSICSGANGASSFSDHFSVALAPGSSWNTWSAPCSRVVHARCPFWSMVTR